MPSSYFPLLWESTRDQWWYASPIDWAAANGHYDLVRELIRLDTNLLIKLTSLRRIRRLESVWDDDAQSDAPMCRSIVAQNLLHDSESGLAKRSLFHAGYGGWLLYSAASAGDLIFVQELLHREPLLVFGEGEYGMTDIFYAAARSKSCEVFRLLFSYVVSPWRCIGGEVAEQPNDVPPGFKWEMTNRSVHAAARGGNVEILRELLGECSDVLAYRDAQGSTILHSASGKGQVEVVKDLVQSFDIITSRDNQCNTPLHIAAYQGHLAVVEALVLGDPSSISLANNSGETFLHMAVTGFWSPGFRRLDRQIELMNKLVHGTFVNLQEIINTRNKEGRTALHLAVAGNTQSNLVELLMSVPSANLNICDTDGMTPLDLLTRRAPSASSEILIKQLISAGGISNATDCLARSTLVSHLKMRGTGSSPGTSFRISDSEIILYADIEKVSDVIGERGNARPSSCSSTSKCEVSNLETVIKHHGQSGSKKPSSINYAARRLKSLLGWPNQKNKNTTHFAVEPIRLLGDKESLESFKKLSNLEDLPTPLRERFSKPSSLPNNKRTQAVRSSLPTNSTKKKCDTGPSHISLYATPHSGFLYYSPSKSPLPSSPTALDKQKGVVYDYEIGEPSSSKISV